MAARFARAHQEASARARGLHPWQVAPVAARFARAHQEASARARPKALLQSIEISAILEVHGIPCGSLPENGRRLAFNRRA